MSLDPALGPAFPRNAIPNPSSHNNITSTSAEPISQESNFSNIESSIRRAIQTSQSERIKKTPPDLAASIDQFKVQLQKLNTLAQRNASLTDEFNKLDDLFDKEEIEDTEKQDAVEEEMDQVDEEMKKIQNDLIRDFPNLNLKKEFFSDWFGLRRVKPELRGLSILFMEEQIINRCLNKIWFLQTTEESIRTQLPRILQTFYPQYEGNLKDISLKLAPQGSETHHRGKNAAKVSFFDGENLLFSVFYKPREARIDALIIDLFKKINQLPTEKKSSDVQLPTYEILNFDTDSESFSVWQTIEGEQHSGMAADTIIRETFISPKKEAFQQQLRRLEAVCRALNVSDLHVENLVFTNEAIVPIDLESIQEGHATGLYEKSLPPSPLSPDEIELILKAKENIGQIPYRFVPVSTSSFLGGLTRCDSFKNLTNVICEEITKKGFKLLIPKEELEWYILSDFVHNDVPYFTEYQSIVYFGKPNEKKPLARR